MDESFKKLNGPTADSIQSDYIAKEQRAAEELLNLQLGNAKKLADLRSKLLKKLNDEALEEGKAVEDYLADYGLQQRLKALDTEMSATKAARLGHLAEVEAIQTATSQKLSEAEARQAKLRTQQLASEAASRKASLASQHRAELSAIREAEELRAKLQAETLAEADSRSLELQVPTIETQTADLEVSPTLTDTVTVEPTELEVTPRLTQELSLAESELSVKPILAEDIVIPDATVKVTPVLTGEVTIPDTTVGVEPIVAPVEPLTTTAQVIPELVQEVVLPGQTLEVTPQVKPLADLEVAAQVTPQVKPLADLELTAQVTPELTGDITLPGKTLEVTPQVAEITIPGKELSLIPNVPDISLPATQLDVVPVVSDVEPLTTTAQVTPEIVGDLNLPGTTVEVTPVVTPIEPLTLEVQDLSVVPHLAEAINIPAAEVEVTPTLGEFKIPATEVEVTPTLGELKIPATTVEVTPEVQPVEPLAITTEATVTPKLAEELEALRVDGLVTPRLATDLVLPPIDAEANVKLNVNETLPAQEAEVLLTPKYITEPEVLQVQADVSLPNELTTTIQVTPEVSELEPLKGQITLEPQVGLIEGLTAEVAVTPKVEPLTELNVTAKVEPVLDPNLELTTELAVHPTPQTSIEDLTKGAEADLALRPVVGEIADQFGTLHLTTDVPEIVPPEVTVKVTPEVGPVETLATTVQVTPIVAPIDIEAQTAALKLAAVLETPVEDQAAVLKLTPEVGELPALETTLKLTPELPTLTAVDLTARVNPDTSELTTLSTEPVIINSEVAPTELIPDSEINRVTQQRIEGLNTVRGLEEALIARRIQAEGEITSTRLTGIAAIDQRVRDLLSASPAVTEVHVDTTDAEATLTTLSETLSEPIRTEASVEVTRVETIVSDSGSGGGSGREIVETPPLTPPPPEVDNSVAIKLQNELRTALADEGTLRSKAHKEEEAQQLRLGRNINEQKIKLAKLNLVEDTVLQQRHQQDIEKQATETALAIKEKELEVRRLSLTTDAELQTQHVLDMEALHANSLLERQKKEIELKQLTLTTEAELTQQYEDKKANAAVDAQTRLERKRQELELLKLGASDAEAIRANAQAALEEENLNKQIKLIQQQTEVEERKAKNQLKFENEILAARLKQVFTGDDAKYAEDPSRLTSDIDDKLTSSGASAEIEASKASLDAEQATALAAALAAAASTGESVEDATARVQAEFDLRRTLAEEAILATYATEDAELAELLAKRDTYEAAEAKAKKTAAKKAEKEEEKLHKKRLGMQAELADYGVAGKFLSSFDFKSMKEAYDEADDKEEANAQIQAQFSAAFDQMGNWVNNLASAGKASSSKQAAIDTRLQGANTKDLGKNVKQKQGSYWKSISADIASGISASPFFRAETVEASFEKIVNEGIAFNVKERAFIDTLKDKIATTFEVADGTLLKLVRIQQADTTAARLGMESALTEFLNSMYATTEYMQQAADSVRQNLYEATALMGAKEATEFEYSVQKWLGSLYSVGFSATDQLADALGKVTAGDVGGITEGGLGNLLVMAANDASLPIATILEKGLDASQTNKLMSAMVQYLSKIYSETKGSNVLAQQFANVYGLTAADLKAAANLQSSVSAIEKKTENYGTMLQQVYDMAGTMAQRTSMGEMFENVKGNFEYSMATTLANNPVLSALNLTANMLNDLVGGIDIPFVNVMGFGFDLNASVADLMNVAALSGAVLGGVGKLVKGLGNLNTNNMLNTFGIEKGTLDAQSRGSGPSLATVSGGKSTSESGYVGNENGDDVKEKTVQDASAEPNKTVAEAKEEEEDKDEARAQALAGHIVDIYELLQDVVSGAKKFHVKLDVGNTPTSWSAGTWQ